MGVIDCCRKTHDLGLKFVALNNSSLKLIMFTDSTSGKATNLSSQAGVIILIANENYNDNILHYGSKKCRIVSKSVMSAELLALVNEYDEAFYVKYNLCEVMACDIPLDFVVDSRTTFSCVAKNAHTLEKRLQIDVAAIRESLFTNKKIRTIGWIPGKRNYADGLTRSEILPCDHPLLALMRTNKLQSTVTGWTENYSTQA